jgi:bacterioferritin-associated ferredoxin
LGIRLGKVIKAVNEGAKTFSEIAKKTGIGRGQCGATRCGATVKRLLEERQKKLDGAASEDDFTPKVVMRKT